MIAKVRRSATAAASLSASAMSQISCFALRPLLAGLAQNASSHAIHARSGIRKKGQGQTVKVGIDKIGRASCRERVCQYVSISVVAVSLKQNIHIYKLCHRSETI